MERLSDTVRVELGRFGDAGDLGEIAERWVEAVGEGIARHAWPSRIARDGTLHVNTADSVWAFELSHRGSEISHRLGVPAIRFAPGPLAVSDHPAPVRPAAEPTQDDRRTAAGIAARIADENLRKTVEKVVALSLADERSGRSL
jgi:Dna[CI] antecedent, DciA